MKKRILALVLAMVMAFALCACGAKTDDSSADTSADTSTGTETVKIICPYGAGGVADLIARKYAEVANGIQTDYNFIVENMTGGDGFVANEYFASEDPMTHDLLVFGYGACYRHDLGKEFGTEEVDWDRSLTYPLGTIDDRIWILYATPGTTLEDVIAKAQDGTLKMSGGNPLSDPHLALGSLLAQIGGTVSVIPYDGGAAQKKGLTDGEVDVFMGATLAGMEEVEAGTLVPLLSFSEEQFTGFKDSSGNVVDVPTVAGEHKAACLDSSIDFSSSILPGGGSLASHVGGDEAFQEAMIQIIKDVWATDDFAGWIADYGLNQFEIYGQEAADWYDASCLKAVNAYKLLSGE